MNSYLAIAALSLALSAPVGATTVSWNFEGDLVFSSISGISTGDKVRGNITFDPTTPDALSDPKQGYYTDPGLFQVEAGTFSKSGSLDWIWVYDNYGNTPSDHFRAEAHNGNDATFYSFRLDLFADANPFVLASDALPVEELMYQPFEFHRIEIQTNNGSASFDISRLDVFSIPEPSSISMALFALIGLATSRARQLREKW